MPVAAEVMLRVPVLVFSLQIMNSEGEVTCYTICQPLRSTAGFGEHCYYTEQVTWVVWPAAEAGSNT